MNRNQFVKRLLAGLGHPSAATAEAAGVFRGFAEAVERRLAQKPPARRRPPRATRRPAGEGA